MNLPKFGSYGEYKDTEGNIRALVFSIGPMDIFYSYTTPVAFQSACHELTVRENDWGPTTGKHLNWIDGGCRAAKIQRIPGDEFEQRLGQIMEGLKQ